MALNPKRIVLFSLLLVGLQVHEARCQTYSLRSLTDGRALFRVSFDGIKELLSIQYANDTLRVRHVLSVTATQVMGNAFLRIAYRFHAGVGMKVTRTLLLSARDQRICQSLSITSAFTEDFMDFSRPRTSPKTVDVKTRYAVGISLQK